MKSELKKKETLLIAESPKEKYISSASEGICLPPHQAKMIWQGNKTLVVGPNFSQLIGKLLYVIGGNDCFCIISLKNPKNIGLKEFSELEEQHRISKDERKNRWANMLNFDACEFDMVKKFDSLKRVPSFDGKTYVEKVEFLEEKKLQHFRNPEAMEKFLSDVSSSEVFSCLDDGEGFLEKIKEILSSKKELLLDEELILFEGVSPMSSRKTFCDKLRLRDYLFGA